MRNVDKFRKFLSEDFDDAIPDPVLPQKSEKITKEKMNPQKMAAIKELQDAYLSGEFESEEDFLTQLAADTGLSFDDYHEFKEYMYNMKTHKKPVDNSNTGMTINSF